MRLITALEKDASAAYTKYKDLGFTASVFSFFQGRATTFAIVFTICGLCLAFEGKLDANYALFVTAIQGLVFAHSCKEDWFAWKKGGNPPPADGSNS
jgi:hypothetical protein